MAGKSATVAGESVAGENPIVGGMAQRYATALFELAIEANAVQTAVADLERFNGFLADSPDLMRLVRSPVVSATEQSRAVAAVLDRAGIGGLAARFLKVLAVNRRLFAVREIFRAFMLLVADHNGEATADVTVAEPLADARLGEIRDALAEVTGKNVKVDVTVDPAIIGGLVVKLGSRMVDSSLRTKLNALRQAMKEVG